MLQAERRAYIIEYIRKEGKVIIEDLAKKIDVSSMTIRRDLDYLEEKDKIIRTHGGAISAESLNKEVSYNHKKEKQIKEKRKIAEYVSNLVKEDQTIILDAGTTNMEIAKAIKNIKNINIITTDLLIASYLSSFKNINVFCTGGIVQSEIGACFGTKALDFLNDIYADIAFLGTSSVDIDKGVTSPTIEKALLKKKIIQVSDKSILVTDSTKFNKKSFSKICSLKELDLIVTDNNIDKNLTEEMKVRDINFYIV